MKSPFLTAILAIALVGTLGWLGFESEANRNYQKGTSDAVAQIDAEIKSGADRCAASGQILAFVSQKNGTSTVVSSGCLPTSPSK